MSSTDEIDSGLCLKVMEGSHQQEVHALTRATIAIGRATPETPYSPAYLTFPEPTLSRLHAELQWNPNTRTFYVSHKSQTNPTLINGRKLTGSVKLSPGDTLALGRLVVVLDVSKQSTSKTEPLIAPPQEPAAHLKIETAHDSVNVPVKKPLVVIQFTDSRSTTAISLEEETAENELVQLHAAAPNEIRLLIDKEAESVTVETRVAEPAVYRKTKVPCGLLSVPIRAATSVMLLEDDFLSHQGHRIYISRTAFHGSSDSTLEGNKESEEVPRFRSSAENGILHFMNGGWSGATLEVPRQGSSAFELGPKSNSFVHIPPLPNSPSCRFTIHDGMVQLRVSQVSDDQFVDVNGELFFTGESTQIFSGSRLLLGEFEFLWLVPALHEQYSRYQVVAPDGTTHPILKQQVRIGTAAHCEVRLPIPALAPVVGTLKYERGEFCYHHTNIALPAKVDGVETSAGLKAKIESGSKLHLAPGVTIGVEELQ